MNDIVFEQIMTKLSSPIFRSAKSVTAKLKISCIPYIELNIDEEPLSDGFVNCSGNFIDTYLIDSREIGNEIIDTLCIVVLN